MKINFHFKIKNLVIYAAVALFSSTSLTGCFSSGDGEAPNAEVNNSGNEASTTEANTTPTGADANAALANGENPPTADGNLALNNGEASTPTNTAPATNTAGAELENLVTDGSANAATTPADPALDSTATGADPFAAPPADATAFLTPPTNPSTDLGAAATPVDASASTPPPTEDPFTPPPTEPVASTATAETTASEPEPAAASEPVASESAAASSEPVAASSEPIPETPDKASTKGVKESHNVETQSVAVPTNGLLPEKGSKMVYYIQKGDTLAKIAGKIYGNAGKWKNLAEENQLNDPSLIYAGDAIFYTLDDNSTSFAQKYESSPRQSVTVSQGDTLCGIAAKVLGNSAEWRTVWKENPHVKNPDLLVIGTVLTFRTTESVANIVDFE